MFIFQTRIGEKAERLLDDASRFVSMMKLNFPHAQEKIQQFLKENPNAMLDKKQLLDQNTSLPANMLRALDPSFVIGEGALKLLILKEQTVLEASQSVQKMWGALEKLTGFSAKEIEQITQALFSKFQEGNRDCYPSPTALISSNEAISPELALLQKACYDILEKKGLVQQFTAVLSDKKSSAEPKVAEGQAKEQAKGVVDYLAFLMAKNIEALGPNVDKLTYQRLATDLQDAAIFIISKASPRKSGKIGSNMQEGQGHNGYLQLESLASQALAYVRQPSFDKGAFYSGEYGKEGKKIAGILQESAEESHNLLKAHQEHVKNSKSGGAGTIFLASADSANKDEWFMKKNRPRA